MTADSRRQTIGILTAALVLAAGAATLALSSETTRLVEALALEEGLSVADVGAGDGEWAESLARVVGPTGHVYATEIDEDDVEQIADRVGQAGLGNVTTILGTENDARLPAGCCEVILLRMVYHHFTDPAPMRASLRRALRPGARIAVIDLEPREDWRDLSGVPDRGGHGIRQDDLVEEMTSDGFEVVERHDGWNGNGNRYCVVFRLADGPAVSEADGLQEEER